jgi:hypothetical protein
MARLTLSIANAFARLKAPELLPIVEFLQAERTDALELMAKSTEEWQWRKLQGRAQLAEELLKYVQDAQTLAAKLNDASR